MAVRDEPGMSAPVGSIGVRAGGKGVFCFGKPLCQLNVYRGNPRDGCYFHHESNDKRMKAKDN